MDNFQEARVLGRTQDTFGISTFRAWNRIDPGAQDRNVIG